MRQYQMDTKEYKKINQIICNCCQKEIAVENGFAREGVFSVDFEWGYFSEKDGEVHSFDLCEKCYDRMVQGFKVPVRNQRCDEE